MIAQPAYTSAALELEEAGDDSDSPLDLAEAFLTADATPTWFTQLPSDLQSYVSSIAAAQATIVAQDTSGAESLRPASGGMGQVWMYGAAAGAVFVGAMLL